MARFESYQNKEGKNETPENWSAEAVFKTEEDILKPLTEESAPTSEKDRSQELNKTSKLKTAVLLSLTLMVLAAPLSGKAETVEEIFRTEKKPEIGAVLEEKADAEFKVGKLKERFADKKLKEKMTLLESDYGGAINYLIFKIKSDEYLLSSLETASEETRAFMNAELAFSYDFFWNKEEIINRANQNQKEPQIIGFENLPQQSNESVKKIFKDIPRELTGNVDKICFIPESKNRISYSVAAEAKDVGIQAVIWRGNRHVAVVYQYPAINESGSLKIMIVHELTHLNDWQSSNRLTMEERLEFLVDVTKNLKDPECVKSEYILRDIPEEYREMGWDEKEMRYRQARELWAEAVEKYIAFPEDFKKLSPKDYALVEKWLPKIGAERK